MNAIHGSLYAVGAVLAIIGLLALTGTLALTIAGGNAQSVGVVAQFTWTTSGQKLVVVSHNIIPSSGCSSLQVGCTNGVIPVTYSASYTFGDGSGTFRGGSSNNHTYTTPGSYIVTEIVTQTTFSGFSVMATKVSGQITVPGNSTGTISTGAAAVVEASFVFATNGVVLNVTDTTQATAATISGVVFNFGDGSSATGPAGYHNAHTYAAPSTYVVTESVTAIPQTQTCSPNPVLCQVPSYSASHNVTIGASNTTKPLNTNPFIQTGMPSPANIPLGLSFLATGVVLIVATSTFGMARKYGWLILITGATFVIVYLGSGGPL